MPVMNPENNRQKILIVAVQVAVIVTAALLFSRGQRSAWRGDSHGNKPDLSSRTPAPAPAAVTVSYLELAPAGESRENALRALATIWTDKDAASALNWAVHLDDAAERIAALETTLLIQSTHDPRQTIELAQQFLLGGALDRILA